MINDPRHAMPERKSFDSERPVIYDYDIFPSIRDPLIILFYDIFQHFRHMKPTES